MKRTALLRRTPLRRTSGRLRRHMKRIKKTLAMGACACCGQWRMLHEHHRQLRAQGGHDGPVVRVCFDCEIWIHANPNEATRTGWIIRRKSA